MCYVGEKVKMININNTNDKQHAKKDKNMKLSISKLYTTKYIR